MSLFLDTLRERVLFFDGGMGYLVRAATRRTRTTAANRPASTT